MSVLLSFTPNLRRHVDCPEARIAATSLREALERYFEAHPRVRGYVLDDQGGLRRHLAVFVNQQLARDRRGLSDPLADGDEVLVVQALSGG